jgi:hypothetical protein
MAYCREVSPSPQGGPSKIRQRRNFRLFVKISKKTIRLSNSEPKKMKNPGEN